MSGATPSDNHGRRYCGHEGRESAIGIGGTLPAWPQAEITWAVVQWIESLDADKQAARNAYRSAIQEAFGRWAAVCGITPSEVPGPTANIQFSLQVEGPGGVLADCQLPFPGIAKNASLLMRVDKAEQWGVFHGRGPGNRVDLVRVLTHELGHGLGLSHLSDGNLMAPVYSDQIEVPQAGDIAQVVARYGRPKPTQPASPPIHTTPQGDAELFRLLRRGAKIVVRFPDGREVTA